METQSKILSSENVPAIVTIATQSFPKVWSPEDFHQFLAHSAGYAVGRFTLDAPPRLVAYLIGLLVQEELDIISIATDPQHRRHGSGLKLLEGAQADPRVRKITLEVDVENIPAIALYRRSGFEVASVRKKYYEQTRDAYLMVWTHSCQRLS